MRYTIIMAVLILVFSGCAGKGTIKPAPGKKKVPVFISDFPRQKGIIYGSGIAEQQNPALAKETADIRAKKNIAVILTRKVTAIIRNYMEQTGIGSSSDIADLSRKITRALSDDEINGIVIEKREYMDGRMYSLARYKIDDSVKKMVVDAVNISFSANEELLDEFREKQGFEELDRQLEKMKACMQ
jgi:hypothetical protein